MLSMSSLTSFGLKEKIKSFKISLIGLLLIPIIIFGSFLLVSFDINYYDKLFDIYGSNSRLQNSHDLGLEIIDFFNYRSELSNPFDQNEISHMRDVRNIFLALRLIFVVSTAILLVYIISSIKEEKHLSIIKDLNKGAIYSVIAVILLALLAIPFNLFFSMFHAIFFPQGNWTFPPDSALIMLFPQEFFQRAFTDVLIFVVVFYIILFYITYVLEKILELKGFTKHEQ